MDFNNYIKIIDVEFNELKNINRNILLNDKEMQILDMYDIDYNNCIDMQELIFKIDSIINYSYDSPDIDDLLWVSKEISDRNYYMNTNK